jgi:NAD-dependent deacetylase
MVSSIFILTGAGISAESGLKTFRDKNGLWQERPVEDFATPQAFRRDPLLVHDFYNMRRRQLLAPDVRPNAAHVAIARLESTWPAEVLVVTQNVDDLHERAGTHNIIHMHGELLKVRCTFCDKVIPWREDAWPETRCPCCGEEGGLRPDVVWFGEAPYGASAIEDAIDECEIFISIGTSATVFTSMAQARAVIAAWRTDYNTTRPHSALGYQTPAARAAELKAMGAAPPPVPGSGTPPIAHTTPDGVISAKALLSAG